MKIGYARVSTREQNLDMQVFALEDVGCETLYEEVTSGSKADRPGYGQKFRRFTPRTPDSELAKQFEALRIID